jgi:hypothetical protein
MTYPLFRRCPHTTVLYVGEDLLDETGDHCCAAKMGGEPGPTGRANLFDTKSKWRASVPKYTKIYVGKHAFYLSRHEKQNYKIP